MPERSYGGLVKIAHLHLNHPLAGQPLIVTLQIVMIENPDEEVSTIASQASDLHILAGEGHY